VRFYRRAFLAYSQPCPSCSIKAKFRDLGYIDADLKSLKYDAETKVAKPLTERSMFLWLHVFFFSRPTVWKRIRPNLETKVIENRDERLARGRRQLISSRQSVVSQLYALCKQRMYTTKPIKHIVFLPRDYDLFKLQPVKDLILREDDEPLQANDQNLAEVFSGLRVLTEDWLATRQMSLIKLLPKQTASGGTASMECFRMCNPGLPDC